MGGIILINNTSLVKQNAKYKLVVRNATINTYEDESVSFVEMSGHT